MQSSEPPITGTPPRAQDPRPRHRSYDMVDLFYWKAGRRLQNFGDHLSLVITTKMLADRGLFLFQAVSRPARLLGLGSILHFARDGDVIWGSGRNGSIAEAEHKFGRLDVRAVRGPLTREFLQAKGIEVPEVYGDPALLLPRLLPHYAGRPKTYDEVFVPNLHDADKRQPVAMAVSPFAPWNRVLGAITASKFVIASSLHALIVAEAYDIPARYLRLSEAEELFKYRDYALGTGRTEFAFARSIEEAREMGGMPPPVFDADALADAFPFDLWAVGGNR